MHLAIFAHASSWPREKGVTPTEFRIAYRIFDPRSDQYISSYSSPLRSHVGSTSNQIHLPAYQLALSDPILDRYDHVKTVIFCPHRLMSQMIDKVITGKEIDDGRFASSFKQKVAPLIDITAHAPTWTERNEYLNEVLGRLLRHDYPGALTPDYTLSMPSLNTKNTIQTYMTQTLKEYEEVHEFNKRQRPLF